MPNTINITASSQVTTFHKNGKIKSLTLYLDDNEILVEFSKLTKICRIVNTGYLRGGYTLVDRDLTAMELGGNNIIKVNQRVEFFENGAIQSLKIENSDNAIVFTFTPSNTLQRCDIFNPCGELEDVINITTPQSN